MLFGEIHGYLLWALFCLDSVLLGRKEAQLFRLNCAPYLCSHLGIGNWFSGVVHQFQKVSANRYITHVYHHIGWWGIALFVYYLPLWIFLSLYHKFSKCPFPLYIQHFSIFLYSHLANLAYYFFLFCMIIWIFMLL